MFLAGPLNPNSKFFPYGPLSEGIKWEKRKEKKTSRSMTLEFLKRRLLFGKVSAKPDYQQC